MNFGLKLCPLECTQCFSKTWPSDRVFDPSWPNFKLDLDIMMINILTKFLDLWIKTVPSRVYTRLYDTSSNDTSSTEPLRRKCFLSNCHFVEFPLRRNSFSSNTFNEIFYAHPSPYCICRSFGLWGYGHWRRLPIWSWLLFLWGCSWGRRESKTMVYWK